MGFSTFHSHSLYSPLPNIISHSKSHEFVYGLISEKKREELFQNIIINSNKSVELLMFVDTEFVKNHRTNIINMIERYHLISSICLNSGSAYMYLCEPDSNPCYLERIEILQSIVQSKEYIHYLLHHAPNYTLRSLKENEIDIVLNKILELDDELLAFDLYNEKEIKLSESQKEKLAPLVVVVKLAK